MEFVLLILGIIGLVLSTNLIITASLNIAEHYKISHIFIGLTILAIGTDLPELSVVVNGALHRLSGIDTSGLIIGETVGTGMSQIALALGIIGLFGTSLFLTKKELVREGSMLLGSVLLLFFLAYDGTLSQLDGAVMILVYAFYFVMLYISEKSEDTEVKRAPPVKMTWSILSLLGGFVILLFASDVVINNALAIATMWGLTQSFVGVVIIGLGTSLPEITVSIGAMAKKSPRLSIGNLLGSNIFDMLLTLGAGTTISGFSVKDSFLWMDLPWLFFTSLLVLIFFFTGQKLTKREAIILLIIYVAYIVLKIVGF